MTGKIPDRKEFVTNLRIEEDTSAVGIYTKQLERVIAENKKMRAELEKLNASTKKGFKDMASSLAKTNKKVVDNQAKTAKKEKRILGQRQKEWENFGRYVKHWAMRFVAMFALFKIADVLREWTFGFIDYAREVKKAVEVSGFASESWQKLEYAGRINLITTGKLLRYIDNMNKSLSRANQLVGDAPMIYRALKLEISSLMEMSPEERFYAIVDALSKVEDQTLKSRAAQVIFGRESRNIFALIKDGAKGIRELGDEFEKFGGIITDETMTVAFESAKFTENLKTMLQKSKIFWGSHFLKLLSAHRWFYDQMTDQETAYWTAKHARDKNLDVIMEKQKELNEAMIYLAKVYGDKVGKVVEEYKTKGTYEDRYMEPYLRKVKELSEEIDILHGIQEKANESLNYAAELWGILGDDALPGVGGELGGINKKTANLPWNIDRINSSLYKFLENLWEMKPLTNKQNQEYGIMLDLIKKLLDEGYGPLLGETELLVNQTERYRDALKDYKNQIYEIAALQMTMAGFPTTPWQLMGSGGKEIEKTFKEGFMAPFKEMEERLTNMKTLGESVGNSLVSGINRASSGLASLIVFGGKFKDVMKDALKETLADLIKIGIQFLIMKTFKLDFTRGAVELGVASTGLIVAGGVISASAKELAAAAALLVAAKLLPFEKGGYVSKGPGSLPKIPKAQKGLITPSNVSDGGMLAILHKNELVLPKPYVGDFFKTAAEKLFFSGRVPSVVPSMASTGGYAPNVYVNIYSPDLTDYVQLKNVARKIGDEIEKDQRRRVV